MISLSVIREEIENCTKCELHKTYTPVPFSEGNYKQGRLMFVFEAPDSEAELYGRPYPGREGLLLKKAMRKAGFGEDDAYWTYAVKCRAICPIPTKYVRACSPAYLSREIELVKPKAIVTYGAVPFGEIMGIKCVRMKNIAETFYMKGDVIVMPSPNPKIILGWPIAVFNKFVENLTALKGKLDGIA